MPFYNGDQEISDKELVRAYRERLANRKAWCVEHAKEFLASKQIAKKYKVDVFYPEVDDTFLVMFSDEELQQFRDLMEKTRIECIEDEHPELIDDLEGWEKWLEDPENEQWWFDCLHDAYLDADFTVPFWNGYCNQDAEVRYVDLYHPVNVYRFNVHYFNYDEPSEKHEGYIYVPLTDEQYIELLASCLDDPEFSTYRLLKSNPELYKIIKERGSRTHYESAIFLTEAKEDAKAILEKFGETQPELPDGPFAPMIAWLATKPENQD